MPWKECHVMDERVCFVTRLGDGDRRHSSDVRHEPRYRKGAVTALMMPVLANLTDADIVDLVAYLSSREP